MNLLKKWMGILCVIGLLMNSLTVGAEGVVYDDNIESGSMTGSNRTEILTLTPGEEPGQIGYGGSEQFGYTGPEAFAVENGAIYILDNINERILVWENEAYREIDISACARASHMRYQNQQLGVVDNPNGITGIYSVTGEIIALIHHPEQIMEEYVAELAEIGDSYVVWKTYTGSCYRYDWVDESMEPWESRIQMTAPAAGAEASISAVSTEDKTWEVASDNRLITLLDTCGRELVYQQYEVIPDVDMLFAELSVRKLDLSGNETYAIIDFSDWHTSPLEPFYVDSAGCVYIMECFEDKAVISAVRLGTTDESQMERLEEQAAIRRETVRLLEGGAQPLAMGDSLLSVTRNEAYGRADQMGNLTWTVLDGHKTVSASMVRVPDSVTNTGTGQTYKGIPYCWGGFNGIDNLPGGTNFASLAASGSYTAGNTDCTNEGGWVSGTIGVDCSGFVSSAYKLSTKYGTRNFASAGHAVDLGDLYYMDYLVDSGNHIVLYIGTFGSKYLVYESHVWGELATEIYADGKVEKSERGITFFEEYKSRSMFCTLCNTSGAMIITVTGHTLTCSACGKAVAEQAHTFVNGKCSVCGVSG